MKYLLSKRKVSKKKLIFKNRLPKIKNHFKLIKKLKKKNKKFSLMMSSPYNTSQFLIENNSSPIYSSENDIECDYDFIGVHNFGKEDLSDFIMKPNREEKNKESLLENDKCNLSTED